MSEVDDGVRGEVGIVVSAVERENGRVRLVFDDVAATSTEPPQEWRSTCLFTWNEYDPDDLADMNLSDEDFQRIGEMVVARIHALRRPGR